MKIISYDVEIKSTKINRAFTTPKVYTNDLNSVIFQFNVLDMAAEELTGATATTLLYMNDGSFFQNPSTDVGLVGNVFSYTLKESEGNHGGLAQIQLVVKIGTKEYATQLYNFDVVRGLETKVAQEVMIYDWTTLTRDARAYIDQFVADEAVRQQQFETAEANRTTEETNRVSAEQGRATTETERVNAESSRVSAESGRVSAEQTRVSAESIRAEFYEGFESELNKKANKQQEDWITPTLLNGATGNLQYRKNNFGMVEFKGIINIPTMGVDVFILQSGYIPSDNINIPIIKAGGAFGYMRVFNYAPVRFYQTGQNDLYHVSYPI